MYWNVSKIVPKDRDNIHSYHGPHDLAKILKEQNYFRESFAFLSA